MAVLLAFQPASLQRPSRHRRKSRPCQPLVVASASSAASSAAADATAPGPAGLTGGNVVVVGGSGRVGGATAAALLAAVPGASVSLASRSQQGFADAVAKRPALAAAAHRQCDIDSHASLAAALKGADLVVHAAGPFQRRRGCNVLEAAIAAGVPYLGEGRVREK